MNYKAFGEFKNEHYKHVPKDLRKNIAFRNHILNKAARSPSYAQHIRQMCKEDMLFYINVFGWTYSPKEMAGQPLIPFISYEFQDECMNELLDCINVGQDAATPKSRDMGASWMCMMVIEYLWHFYKNLSFLVVSRKEDLVDKRGFPGALFWKVDFILKYQPKWLLPKGWHLDAKANSLNRKSMHIFNPETNSVMDGESTTGNVDRKSVV